MRGLWQDLRYGIRILGKSPGFTFVAVMILALGIGANTALFTLLDAVLLRALQFRDPDRLVTIWGQDAERGGWRIPIALTDALHERAATIEAISIHNAAGREIRTLEGPVRIAGQRVSANFIEFMGIPPLAGRGFLREEENPGAAAVMVVSFEFWQQRMAGDPEAVGRTLYVDETPYTVVGVMPPEFQDYFTNRADYWTPYGSDEIREHERKVGHELWARLAPGVTIEESLRELEVIAASVEVEEWRKAGRRFGMTAFKDDIVGDSAYALKLLLAAVAVVLMIACANLAQLLLARSDRRVSEFATRKALGAPAWQLFRLALVESLLLSAVGGAGGVALAYWLLPAMLALAPAEIPRITEAAIDARVLSVAVGMTVLTGCGFGIAPAFRLARLSVIQAMKHSSGNASPERARFRSALVVGQVASSVVLFVLAGLIGQTFLTLLPSNPGFEAKSRTVLSLYLRPDLYPERADRVRRWEELMARVAALPGITAAGIGENVPFGSDDGFRSVSGLNETGGARSGEPLRVDRRAVSPNYFQLLQMPLVRGRIFTSADRAESPGVAIVNERLARKLAGGGDVLGQKVQIQATPLPAYEIVGVVANARSVGTTVEVWDEIYIPHAQSGATLRFLIVQSELDRAALDPMLRSEIRSWAPALPQDPWTTATPLEDLMSNSVARPRFSATLISAFSGMALLLAAMGVFGLVAYSGSQRSKEFGIRAALGARPRDLLTTSIRSAVALTASGVALGLVAAVYLTQFVESQLHDVERLDPAIFAAAGAVMLVVSGLAGYIPARRASRIDPMATLRID